MIGHRVVLRPRTISETGDLAAAFVRAHGRLYLRLLPWVLIPGLACALLHAYAGLPKEAAFTLEVGLLGVFGGVYTLLCGDLMLRGDVQANTTSRAFSRLLPAFAVKRLLSWALLAMTALLGYGWVAFVPEATLLERGSISAASTRSAALLKATPGRMIAWGLVTLLLLAVGAVGAELLYHAARSLIGIGADVKTLAAEHVNAAPFLGVALIQPYVVTMRFLLYIDCRTRREGWDLQVQLNALVVAAQVRTGGGPREAA